MDATSNTADPATRAGVQPQLSVRRGRQALDFSKAAFGAKEIYRVGGTDDHADVVAQLLVGNSSIWVSDESPTNGNFSPRIIGRSHRATVVDRARS